MKVNFAKYSIGMQVAGFTQGQDLDLFQSVQNTLWFVLYYPMFTKYPVV